MSSGESREGQSDPQGEQVIEEFLGEQPRADHWRSLKETLAERLRDAVVARDEADPDDLQFLALEKKIRDLREQVRVLAEEEAITRFVEDSVRATLTRPRNFQLGDEFDLDDEGYG
ncbi:MAG: hypothetical protein H7Z41_09710 [Cytophagales bacterium]|nr:hypothetical protein [Armatimonadota bacterium]